MSEGIVVPAMNQWPRISSHLICTIVELNRSLNNTSQTKREWNAGNYKGGEFWKLFSFEKSPVSKAPYWVFVNVKWSLLIYQRSLARPMLKASSSIWGIMFSCQFSGVQAVFMLHVCYTPCTRPWPQHLGMMVPQVSKLTAMLQREAVRKDQPLCPLAFRR